MDNNKDNIIPFKGKKDTVPMLTADSIIAKLKALNEKILELRKEAEARLRSGLTFSDKELECPCGCGCIVRDMTRLKLEQLRHLMGMPLLVVSAARCRMHNSILGEHALSQHVNLCAVDIKWDEMPGEQRLQLIERAKALGFTGFGLHPQFLHIDDREGGIVFWFYPLGERKRS